MSVDTSKLRRFSVYVKDSEKKVEVKADKYKLLDGYLHFWADEVEVATFLRWDFVVEEFV